MKSGACLGWSPRAGSMRIPKSSCGCVLASIPLAIRLVAVASGVAGYFLIRRSVFAGVIVGEVVLIVGALLSGR